MKRHTILRFIINSFYFVLVFGVALAVATLALTRKINSYQASRQPILFNIKKQEIVITNSVNGRLEKLSVTPGQHVNKGDLMAQLVDETIDSKLSSLESVSTDNLSARTEAQILKAQKPQYEIRAPRDGVIYRIDVAEGTYLNQTTPMLVLFADQDIKLVGYVNAENYAKIQKDKTLDVYSPRFGQVYSIVLEGAGRVIPATQYAESKYELQFRFVDPDEGTAFIQGEGLEVISETKQDTAMTPADRIAQFWNSFIVGK